MYYEALDSALKVAEVYLVICVVVCVCLGRAARVLLKGGPGSCSSRGKHPGSGGEPAQVAVDEVAPKRS